MSLRKYIGCHEWCAVKKRQKPNTKNKIDPVSGGRTHRRESLIDRRWGGTGTVGAPCAPNADASTTAIHIMALPFSSSAARKKKKKKTGLATLLKLRQNAGSPRRPNMWTGGGGVLMGGVGIHKTRVSHRASETGRSASQGQGHLCRRPVLKPDSVRALELLQRWPPPDVPPLPSPYTLGSRPVADMNHARW